MNDIIKNIINAKSSKEEKIKILNSLREDIEIAKAILANVYKYCPDCDDYYLAESYLTKTEVKETQICIYRGVINSGENEYEDGYADITYSICPKNHMHEINRVERRKK